MIIITTINDDNNKHNNANRSTNCPRSLAFAASASDLAFATN